MNNFSSDLNSLKTAFQYGVDFVKSVKDCDDLLNAVENSGYVRLRVALRLVGYIQIGFSIFVVLYLAYLVMINGGHREGRLAYVWKHNRRSIIGVLVVLVIIIIVYQVLNTYIKHYIESLMIDQVDNIIGCSMELVKRISTNDMNHRSMSKVQNATNVLSDKMQMSAENMYPYT